LIGLFNKVAYFENKLRDVNKVKYTDLLK